MASRSWQRRASIDADLRVAVVRLPRMSNVTDVEALAAEPGVEVLVTSDPQAIARADLAVLPGTRSTVSDLDWLRRRGLGKVISDRAGRDAPVLGICGGYQMLAQQIDDSIESSRGMGCRWLASESGRFADRFVDASSGSISQGVGNE